MRTARITWTEWLHSLDGRGVVFLDGDASWHFRRPPRRIGDALWVVGVLDRVVAFNLLLAAKQLRVGMESSDRSVSPDGVVAKRCWEDWARHVAVWSRIGVRVVPASTLTLTGCSDAWNAGPLQYVENEALTKDLKGKANLAGKPVLQTGRPQGAGAALWRFAPADQGSRRVRDCPRGALPGELHAGRAKALRRSIVGSTRLRTSPSPPLSSRPTTRTCSRNQAATRCTAGIAFTATASRGRRWAHGPVFVSRAARLSQGNLQVHLDPQRRQPHRSDLRRTINNGLHGTSMPAFDSLMTAAEIEQVIDYVMFLSMRGETELALIEEAVDRRRERSQRLVG